MYTSPPTTLLPRPKPYLILRNSKRKAADSREEEEEIFGATTFLHELLKTQQESDEFLKIQQRTFDESSELEALMLKWKEAAGSVV